MGLTMSQRPAVTKAIAVRYKRASRGEKGVILDEFCATTGWHRNHARKALGQGLAPKVVRPRGPRVPKLRRPSWSGCSSAGWCWGRLSSERAAMTLRERSHTQPGSLLKDAIPIRTYFS